MSRTESTEMVEAEPLVSPADPKRVLEVMRRFEEFKRQALTPNDFVVLEIGKDRKPYIKKSGWMKYALACQLSLEKRDERLEERPDGSKAYHYTYRALAPNGRFADAVGSASTTERAFTHPDHDVRALAQTRACNRAISNLVAGGEVSAEEILSDIKEEGTSQPDNIPIETNEHPASETVWTVPLTSDQGTPDLFAKGLKQYPLGRNLRSFGMVNVLGDETSIIPEKPIPTNSALIDGFLVRRVIEPLVAKHSLAYTIRRSDGFLEAILIRGTVPQEQLRELISGARWAFEKALENESMKKGSRP